MVKLHSTSKFKPTFYVVFAKNGTVKHMYCKKYGYYAIKVGNMYEEKFKKISKNVMLEVNKLSKSMYFKCKK